MTDMTSSIDELIENIDHKRKNPSKKDLWDFIEQSLKQI
jgi:hypothetical protein